MVDRLVVVIILTIVHFSFSLSFPPHFSINVLPQWVGVGVCHENFHLFEKNII
jgi:hypothetical protein